MRIAQMRIAEMRIAEMRTTHNFISWIFIHRTKFIEHRRNKIKNHFKSFSKGNFFIFVKFLVFLWNFLRKNFYFHSFSCSLICFSLFPHLQITRSVNIHWWPIVFLNYRKYNLMRLHSTSFAMSIANSFSSMKMKGLCGGKVK